MFFAARLIGAAALLSGLAISAPNSMPVSATASGSTIVTASPSYNSGSGWASPSALAIATPSPQSYGSGSSWSSPPSYGSGSSSYSPPSYGSGSSWSPSPSYGSGPPSYSPSSYGSGPSWSPSSSYGSGSPSYSAPSYGSGSSGWGNYNYNNCVQQCVASFGSPSATYTPPTATTGVSGSGSSGSGATYTVIVAPTQGVLRFVPFAVNASIGDTIQFRWGANNHTVTKSSALTPCNKTSVNPFSSGEQNKGFVFSQLVNNTNPTFFYCGTPTHCQKGMFGIINPPNALGSPASASGMMQSLAANNSALATYANYTNNNTAGNAAAAEWGGSINMSSLPNWAHEYAAENIMYTRNFLAANSEVLQNGSVNLSLAGSMHMIYPQDFTSAAVNSTGTNATGATSSTTSPSISSSSNPPPSASSLGSSTNTTSTAISTSSSKVLLSLVVGFATFMML